MIPNDELINDFAEHFIKWKPYIKKYGLILLELHTLDPDLSRTIEELTPCIAYDATHGFSDQYLIEHEIFNTVLEKINLKVDIKYQSLFPNNKFPTISINYIK